MGVTHPRTQVTECAEVGSFHLYLGVSQHTWALVMLPSLQGQVHGSA